MACLALADLPGGRNDAIEPCHLAVAPGLQLQVGQQRLGQHRLVGRRASGGVHTLPVGRGMYEGIAPCQLGSTCCLESLCRLPRAVSSPD